MLDGLLRMTELAALVGVSSATVRGWCRRLGIREVRASLVRGGVRGPTGGPAYIKKRDALEVIDYLAGRLTQKRKAIVRTRLWEYANARKVSTRNLTHVVHGLGIDGSVEEELCSPEVSSLPGAGDVGLTGGGGPVSAAEGDAESGEGLKELVEPEAPYEVDGGDLRGRGGVVEAGESGAQVANEGGESVHGQLVDVGVG